MRPSFPARSSLYRVSAYWVICVSLLVTSLSLQAQQTEIPKTVEPGLLEKQFEQEIYDMLGVEIVERGESFYNPLLKKTVEELENFIVRYFYNPNRT